MLTQDEQERMRYEARQMAIRDQISLLEDAKEQGLEKGLEKGRVQGLERGELIGRIHLCERILKRPLTPSDDLLQLAAEELARQAETLEAQVLKG